MPNNWSCRTKRGKRRDIFIQLLQSPGCCADLFACLFTRRWKRWNHPTWSNCKMPVPLLRWREKERLGVSADTSPRWLHGLVSRVRPLVSQYVGYVGYVIEQRARVLCAMQAQRGSARSARISHADEIVFLTCGIPFIPSPLYSLYFIFRARGEPL